MKMTWYLLPCLKERKAALGHSFSFLRADQDTPHKRRCGTRGLPVSLEADFFRAGDENSFLQKQNALFSALTPENAKD